MTGASRTLRLPPLRRAGDILTRYLTAIGGLRDVLGKGGIQHFPKPARDFDISEFVTWAATPRKITMSGGSGAPASEGASPAKRKVMDLEPGAEVEVVEQGRVTLATLQATLHVPGHLATTRTTTPCQTCSQGEEMHPGARRGARPPGGRVCDGDRVVQGAPCIVGSWPDERRGN